MAAQFNIQVAVSGFRNRKGQFASLANALPGGLHEVHERLGPEMIRQIQQDTPEASGTLAEGWAYDISFGGEESTLNFTNDVGYLDAVLKGRKPGWMYARNAPFMVFWYEGSLHFRKEVFHPGTKPNNFLEGTDGQYIRFMTEEMTFMAQVLMNRYLTDG